MRYKLKDVSIGPEAPCFDIQEEKRNKKDELILPYKETLIKGKYFVGITLQIIDTESTSTQFPEGFEFTEAFTVISDNSQTGDEVDKQRKSAITRFMKKLENN